MHVSVSCIIDNKCKICWKHKLYHKSLGEWILYKMDLYDEYKRTEYFVAESIYKYLQMLYVVESI